MTKSKADRIELPPPLPAEPSESGITLDVTHPDTGERRRITIQQPTNDRHTNREVIDTGSIGWSPADHELPRGRWPGSGERRETCGKDVPLTCRDCGDVREVGASCHESRCPRCWRSWCLKRAKQATMNVSAYARVRASGMRDPSDLYRHHITVSFPADTRFGASDTLGAGFGVVRRIMRLIDVEAGYIVYHPFRIAKEYRGEVLGHESGSGDMTPADVLAKVASPEWSWPAVESELLSYEPHFHVVGVAPPVERSFCTDIYDRTGIVTHRIENTDHVSISYGEAPTAGVLAYNLSHCGLIDGEGQTRDTIRAFGPIDHFDTAGVESEIGAAIRAVSQKVVGIELPSGRCDAPVPADGPADGRSFARETPGSVGEGLARAELADADSANTVRCEGERMPPRETRKYLALPASEWSIPPTRREDVRQAIESWGRFVESAGVTPEAVAPTFAPADD